MTFIGIVIFTVYSSLKIYTASGVVGVPDKEIGVADSAQEVPQYFGEFSSEQACDAAAFNVRYRLKKGETRVDKVSEVLCVPKTHK